MHTVVSELDDKLHSIHTKTVLDHFFEEYPENGAWETFMSVDEGRYTSNIPGFKPHLHLHYIDISDIQQAAEDLIEMLEAHYRSLVDQGVLQSKFADK